MSYDEGRAPSTVSAILRALGGIGPSGGPILYMLRSLTITTTCAIVTGGIFAWSTQVVCGLGALGFVFGSCMGFVTSSIAYFVHCRRHAVHALERFPSLMKMHLMLNFRMAGFEKLRLESDKEVADFKQEVMSSLKLKCWLVAAWQSAASSIEEVERRREADLVTELGSKST